MSSLVVYSDISCCGITVCAGDQPNINAGWAKADWERRQEIIADHTYFEMGAYFYLANDPKVLPLRSSPQIFLLTVRHHSFVAF